MPVQSMDPEELYVIVLWSVTTVLEILILTAVGLYLCHYHINPVKTIWWEPKERQRLR